MEIFESDKRSTTKAKADWFTGDVWMDEIAIAGEPSRLRVLRVTFAPGARTAWHTHPPVRFFMLSPESASFSWRDKRRGPFDLATPW